MTCDKLGTQMFKYEKSLTVPVLHCFVALCCIGGVLVAYLIHKEAVQAQTNGLNVSHTCSMFISFWQH